MCDIIKKMCYQVPGGFKRLYIFLSAYMAILTLNFCITVQAVFFCSFFKMTQGS